MNQPDPIERRRLERRNLSNYLPIMDNNSQQGIGHLVDISPNGLMMDSSMPVPTNLKYSLRLDLTEECAGKASLEFIAISKWCRPGPFQPYMYNAGFEIADIPPDDMEVIKCIADKYGT